ncbi:hypothetical protein Vretimale_1433, partial [Volvox reticuliferus]
PPPLSPPSLPSQSPQPPSASSAPVPALVSPASGTPPFPTPWLPTSLKQPPPFLSQSPSPQQPPLLPSVSTPSSPLPPPSPSTQPLLPPSPLPPPSPSTQPLLPPSPLPPPSPSTQSSAPPLLPPSPLPPPSPSTQPLLPPSPLPPPSPSMQPSSPSLLPSSPLPPPSPSTQPSAPPLLPPSPLPPPSPSTQPLLPPSPLPPPSPSMQPSSPSLLPSSPLPPPSPSTQPSAPPLLPPSPLPPPSPSTQPLLPPSPLPPPSPSTQPSAPSLLPPSPLPPPSPSTQPSAPPLLPPSPLPPPSPSTQPLLPPSPLPPPSPSMQPSSPSLLPSSPLPPPSPSTQPSAPPLLPPSPLPPPSPSTQPLLPPSPLPPPSPSTQPLLPPSPLPPPSPSTQPSGPPLLPPSPLPPQSPSMQPLLPSSPPVLPGPASSSLSPPTSLPPTAPIQPLPALPRPPQPQPQERQQSPGLPRFDPPVQMPALAPPSKPLQLSSPLPSPSPAIPSSAPSPAPPWQLPPSRTHDPPSPEAPLQPVTAVPPYPRPPAPKPPVPKQRSPRPPEDSEASRPLLPPVLMPSVPQPPIHQSPAPPSSPSLQPLPPQLPPTPSPLPSPLPLHPFSSPQLFPWPSSPDLPSLPLSPFPSPSSHSPPSLLPPAGMPAPFVPISATPGAPPPSSPLLSPPPPRLPTPLRPASSSSMPPPLPPLALSPQMLPLIPTGTLPPLPSPPSSPSLSLQPSLPLTPPMSPSSPPPPPPPPPPQPPSSPPPPPPSPPPLLSPSPPPPPPPPSSPSPPPPPPPTSPPPTPPSSSPHTSQSPSLPPLTSPKPPPLPPVPSPWPPPSPPPSPIPTNLTVPPALLDTSGIPFAVMTLTRDTVLQGVELSDPALLAALFPGAKEVQPVSYNIKVPLAVVPINSAGANSLVACSSDFQTLVQKQFLTWMPFSGINLTSAACTTAGPVQGAGRRRLQHGELLREVAVATPMMLEATSPSSRQRELQQSEAAPPDITFGGSSENQADKHSVGACAADSAAFIAFTVSLPSNSVAPSPSGSGSGGSSISAEVYESMRSWQSAQEASSASAGGSSGTAPQLLVCGPSADEVSVSTKVRALYEVALSAEGAAALAAECASGNASGTDSGSTCTITPGPGAAPAQSFKRPPPYLSQSVTDPANPDAKPPAARKSTPPLGILAAVGAAALAAVAFAVFVAVRHRRRQRRNQRGSGDLTDASKMGAAEAETDTAEADAGAQDETGNQLACVGRDELYGANARGPPALYEASAGMPRFAGWSRLSTSVGCSGRGPHRTVATSGGNSTNHSAPRSDLGPCAAVAYRRTPRESSGGGCGCGEDGVFHVSLSDLAMSSSDGDGSSDDGSTYITPRLLHRDYNISKQHPAELKGTPTAQAAARDTPRKDPYSRPLSLGQPARGRALRLYEQACVSAGTATQSSRTRHAPPRNLRSVVSVRAAVRASMRDAEEAPWGRGRGGGAGAYGGKQWPPDPALSSSRPADAEPGTQAALPPSGVHIDDCLEVVPLLPESEPPPPRPLPPLRLLTARLGSAVDEGDSPPFAQSVQCPAQDSGNLESQRGMNGVVVSPRQRAVLGPRADTDVGVDVDADLTSPDAGEGSALTSQLLPPPPQRPKQLAWHHPDDEPVFWQRIPNDAITSGSTAREDAGSWPTSPAATRGGAAGTSPGLAAADAAVAAAIGSLVATLGTQRSWSGSESSPSLAATMRSFTSRTADGECSKTPSSRQTSPRTSQGLKRLPSPRVHPSPITTPDRGTSPPEGWNPRTTVAVVASPPLPSPPPPLSLVSRGPAENTSSVFVSNADTVAAEAVVGTISAAPMAATPQPPPPPPLQSRLPQGTLGPGSQSGTWRQLMAVAETLATMAGTATNRIAGLTAGWQWSRPSSGGSTGGGGGGGGSGNSSGNRFTAPPEAASAGGSARASSRQESLNRQTSNTSETVAVPWISAMSASVTTLGQNSEKKSSTLALELRPPTLNDALSGPMPGSFLPLPPGAELNAAASAASAVVQPSPTPIQQLTFAPASVTTLLNLSPQHDQQRRGGLVQQPRAAAEMDMEYLAFESGVFQDLISYSQPPPPPQQQQQQHQHQHPRKQNLLQTRPRHLSHPTLGDELLREPQQELPALLTRCSSAGVATTGRARLDDDGFGLTDSRFSSDELRRGASDAATGLEHPRALFGRPELSTPDCHQCGSAPAQTQLATTAAAEREVHDAVRPSSRLAWHSPRGNHVRAADGGDEDWDDGCDEDVDNEVPGLGNSAIIPCAMLQPPPPLNQDAAAAGTSMAWAYGTPASSGDGGGATSATSHNPHSGGGGGDSSSSGGGFGGAVQTADALTQRSDGSRPQRRNARSGRGSGSSAPSRLPFPLPSQPACQFPVRGEVLIIEDVAIGTFPNLPGLTLMFRVRWRQHNSRHGDLPYSAWMPYGQLPPGDGHEALRRFMQTARWRRFKSSNQYVQFARNNRGEVPRLVTISEGEDEDGVTPGLGNPFQGP